MQLHGSVIACKLVSGLRNIGPNRLTTLFILAVLFSFADLVFIVLVFTEDCVFYIGTLTALRSYWHCVM